MTNCRVDYETSEHYRKIELEEQAQADQLQRDAAVIKEILDRVMAGEDVPITLSYSGQIYVVSIHLISIQGHDDFSDVIKHAINNEHEKASTLLREITYTEALNEICAVYTDFTTDEIKEVIDNDN